MNAGAKSSLPATASVLLSCAKPPSDGSREAQCIETADSRRVTGWKWRHGIGLRSQSEVTAKVLKRGIRIVEVPIHYEARSYAQGKKIRWTDGVAAIWTLIKYRFVK